MRGGAGGRDGGVDEVAGLSDFNLFAHHDALFILSHLANRYSMTPSSSSCVTVAREAV